MKIAALALAGLVATAVVTANPAHADLMASPAPSHFYPLQPLSGPVIDPDPVVAVQNFQGQIAELHDMSGRSGGVGVNRHATPAPGTGLSKT